MKDYLPLIIIALCLPFVLWGVCDILPTFDDYTSLQSPWQVQIADPGYFFSDAVRRPFDYLLGLVVGHYPTLFPTLNHVLIILGHTASTTLVFVLCRRLRMSRLATNVATLFFFFSPATLGATLACDGFNQTYAQLWGLLALYTYLRAADNCSASHATANFSLITRHFSLDFTFNKDDHEDSSNYFNNSQNEFCVVGPKVVLLLVHNVDCIFSMFLCVFNQ